MKKIPLTQGKFALVDDEDFEYLNQWKWYASKDKYTYYARRTLNINKKHVTIRMHRVLLDAKQVDHKDGNGLNNQRNNLRSCNITQNHWNRRPKEGSSKYKGVDWNKKTKKWRVRFTSYGKQTHLGYFTDEIEAAKAYDRAAIMYFEEFAWINFNKENY